MRQLIIVFGTCLLQATALHAQPDLHRYVKLHMQYYEEGGERYLGVTPDLIITGTDMLSSGMATYPRRFRYAVLNKTRFQGIYEKYYPDTTRINRLFADSLSQDKAFVLLFDQLSQPFLKVKSARLRFTKEQLLKVAARFFYCQSVRADSTIAATICIGRNGLADLAIGPGQALLEAFCFEAIFEKYYSSPQVKSVFVRNFLTYVEEGASIFRQRMNDRDHYLTNVRNYCFEKMENDKPLAEALMKYYEESRQTWAMDIE